MSIKKRFAVLSLLLFTALSSACVGHALTFAVLTDMHVRTEENVQSFQKVIGDLNALQPQPEFALVLGDLTDLASVEEMEKYTALAKTIRIPTYPIMGNHDSRWSGVGRKHFEKLLGPTHRSFDSGDVHFALLDSSVELEQYGHIPPDQLAWLDEDLAKVPEGKLKIVASHHPPFSSSRYIDNEDALMEILTKHRVRFFLAGHLHSHTHASVNGVEIVTFPAVMEQERYSIVQVGDQNVEFTTHDLKVHQNNLELSCAKTSPTIPDWEILTPKPNGIVRGGTDVEVLAPSFTEASFRLDGKPAEKLKKSGEAFTGEVSGAMLSEGSHLLRVDGKENKDASYTRQISFTKQRGDKRIALDFATKSEIQSSPLATDKPYFFGLLSTKRLYAGSNDHNVYALDRRNGKVKWKFDTGAAVMSGPTYYKGRIYIGSDSGNLYCLNARNGNVRWTFKTEGAVYSSPRVANGSVYFGSGDGCVYALDAKKGTLRWKFKTGNLVKCRPECAAGRVYFGSWDTFFYAVDEKTGELAWKYQVSDQALYSPATSNPVYSDGLVIVASHDYVVHAFDAATGKEVWKADQTKTRKPSYSTAAILNGRAYFGSITGNVVCLDVKTGNEVWNASLNGDPIFDSCPVIYEDRVYVGSVGGKLYGVSIDTGKLVDTFSLAPGYIFSSPAAADGVVYVGSFDGHLYGVIPAKEEERPQKAQKTQKKTQGRHKEVVVP